MPDIGSIAVAVDKWQNALSAPTRQIIEMVLSGSVRCFVFGRNCHGEFIERHLTLAGYVDDFSAPGTTASGLPVISSDVLPAGSVVVNAALGRQPWQAARRLTSLASAPVVIDYADFTRYLPQRFPPLPFVAETRAVFSARSQEFSSLAKRLADGASRRTFIDLMHYRLTGDPAFMADYRLRESEQYFDVPLNLPAGAVFVDGGGYCGENSETFAQRYPDYGGIHVFEPNPVSMARARACLRHCRDVFYHMCALGNVPGTLSFDATGGSSSRISAGGEVCVPVMRLDDVLEVPVDFIKFDLEGYDTKALAGARRLIARSHPALAMCVYHHPRDFVDVPGIVLSVRDDYRIELRHYTEGWGETVMYFLPERGGG